MIPGYDLAINETLVSAIMDMWITNNCNKINLKLIKFQNGQIHYNSIQFFV